MAFVPVEGKDYTRLANPGPVDKPGLIEVREFFWYGCGHCYNLEPHVVGWLKTKPADVNFVRTPAALNAVWESNARGYYVAEMRGLVGKTHGPLFAAMGHEDGLLAAQDIAGVSSPAALSLAYDATREIRPTIGGHEYRLRVLADTQQYADPDGRAPRPAGPRIAGRSGRGRRGLWTDANRRDQGAGHSRHCRPAAAQRWPAAW